MVDADCLPVVCDYWQVDAGFIQQDRSARPAQRPPSNNQRPPAKNQNKSGGK